MEPPQLPGFCSSCVVETTEASAGGTFTLNGIGTRLYSFGGEACPTCGSKKATKFLTFLFIPVIAEDSYRVLYLHRKLFKNQQYLSRRSIEQPTGLKKNWMVAVWAVAILVAYALGANTQKVNTLKVGDCFDSGAGLSSSVADVQRRGCGDPHFAEVFYVGNLPGGPPAYPNSTQMASMVGTLCLPAYRSYTGREFRTEKTYDIQYLVPTAAGWSKGDRGLSCFAIRLDHQPATGSVKTAP